MHSLLYSFLGLSGMSVCLWALQDWCRVVMMDCLTATHLVSQRLWIQQYAESHTRMLVRLNSIEVSVEKFEEVLIEVAEPFVC